MFRCRLIDAPSRRLSHLAELRLRIRDHPCIVILKPLSIIIRPLGLRIDCQECFCMVCEHSLNSGISPSCLYCTWVLSTSARGCRSRSVSYSHFCHCQLFSVARITRLGLQVPYSQRPYITPRPCLPRLRTAATMSYDQALSKAHWLPNVKKQATHPPQAIGPEGLGATSH